MLRVVRMNLRAAVRTFRLYNHGSTLRCSGVSALPLDRTAHGSELLHRPMACLGDLLHGFKQVAASVRDRRHPRSIKATSILQFVLCVEAEEIGCALSDIGACD